MTASERYEDDPTLTESIKPVGHGAAEQLSVMVVCGPEAGHWYKVPAKGGVVGRHPDVAIRIADPGVSRRHAIIERVGEGNYVIRDLGSRNGVYVNGERASVRQLYDGVQVQLSSQTVLRFRYRGRQETEILDELQRAATTDPLTGVANRRYLMSRLEQELSFARRHHTPLSVLLVDLDGFKKVNDDLGHAVGDAVLRTVATTLADSTRLEDVVARYGGDEFVIIARGYAPESAVLLAERLCHAARSRSLEVAEKQLVITLSIGVAGYAPRSAGGDEPGVDPVELLARADWALYHQKRSGRDGTTAWSSRTRGSPGEHYWRRRTPIDAPTAKDPE